ncbi:MAG: hypothetical protein AAF677_04210 [Pseudomonadota bacterium]
MPDRQRGTLPLALGVVAIDPMPLAWAVLAAVFLEAAIEITLGLRLSLIIDFLLHASVMYAGLRTLQSGGSVRGVPAALTPAGEVPWLFFARLFLLGIPGLLAVFLLLGLLTPALGQRAAVTAGVAANIAVGAVILGLFGSMLNDIARGGRGDPQEALERGHQRWVALAVALVLGPGLVNAGLFALHMTLDALGLPLSAVDPEATHLNPVGLFATASTYVVSALTALMTAAALVQSDKTPNGRDADAF